MFTTLSIINEMVGSTGSRPFAAEQTTHPLFIKALATLDRVSATVQSKGLWFNTEVREIQNTVDNELFVPQDCIKADPVDRHHNLTLRGNRMYDLDTGTYEVTEPVVLKMGFKVSLEEMPLTAQEYVRANAVYAFYRAEDGANPKLGHYQAEADRGWMFLYREHIRSIQANAFDNSNSVVNRVRRGSRPYSTSLTFSGKS